MPSETPKSKQKPRYYPWIFLVALTVSCVWLGFMLVKSGTSSSQAKAILEIEESGGFVDGKRNIHGRLLVWHVTLPNKPSNRIVECLKEFPSLKSVTIKGEQLSKNETMQLQRELGVQVTSFIPVQVTP